jgi:hypothetical protein
MTRMIDEQIQRIVAEVISRLAPRLGADGRRGYLIVVITGATAAFGEAVQQVRSLVLDGYRLRLAFSQAAEQLFGQLVRDELAGFPHVGLLEPARWLAALAGARAVVSPLMSVNTLSKVSLLLADDLVTNLILHALFMGKAVVVARDGADPTGSGRSALSFDKGRGALNEALFNRLQIVADYGCRLTEVQRLRETVNSILTNEADSGAKASDPAFQPTPPRCNYSGRVVTAADIRHARRFGGRVRISSGSVITPLARDLAVKHGVALVESHDEGRH